MMMSPFEVSNCTNGCCILDLWYWCWCWYIYDYVEKYATENKDDDVDRGKY